MKKSIKWILIVVGVLAVAAVVVGFITQGKFTTQTATTTAQKTQTNQTVAAKMGSLTVTIATTGAVRPAQSATLNWQVSGTVGKVSAQVGQKVNQNDILATIDLTSLPQSLIKAQSDLITAKQALQDLMDGSATNESTALQTLAAAQKELSDATTAAASRQYAKASQATIDAAQANLAMAQADYDTAANKADNLKSLPQDSTKRAQAFNNLATAQQKLHKDQIAYDALLAGPDPSLVAQANARVEVAKTKLADAQREVDRWKNGPSQDDLTMAKNKIIIAQAAVNTERIVAPFNGTITDVTSQAGDVVTSGAEAMRIDDLSKQFVDMQVTEIDVNKVKVGQLVGITFDAIANKHYNGKVTQVGQVGTTTSGVVYYDVTAQLTDADQLVKPGMTAAVTITVSQSDNVLLVPSRSIRTVGQRHIVYKPGTNGATVPVPVQVGAVSDVETEITSGLKTGDVILANPPALTATTPGANRGFGLGGGFGGGGGRPPGD
jgi:HlyD family secretion protein